MAFTKLSALLAAALGAVAGALIGAFAFGTDGIAVLLGALLGAAIAVIDLFILSRFHSARRQDR